MAFQAIQQFFSNKSASTTPSSGVTADGSLNQSLTPPVDQEASTEPAAPPTNTTDTRSSGPTRENFDAEMKWERHGYRPITFFKTVEEAVASQIDTNKIEAFVGVKHAGFTADELAAIPDNAKITSNTFPFVTQLLDSQEGIFTKKFWTNFEGIKKVISSGFIKSEAVDIQLEAAQWLLRKREAVTAPIATPPTLENAPAISSEQENDDNRFEPPVPQGSLTPSPLRKEPKVFEMADLSPLEKRLQERFEALKVSIAPRTLTVVVEDSASIDTVIQNLKFYKDFNKAFADQASKTQAVLDQVGKLGLDQPLQGIVFKKKQDEALRLIDELSFSKRDLAMIADKIELAHGATLPGSMREAVKNAEPFLDAIKKELEEARNIIRNARRINPAPKVNPPSPEEKSQLVTGSVAKMPRLGKDLTVDPKKLENMGHAMVDANVPDQEMNEKYKAVMSEFVKSYVSTFSKIRKEIYEARMDGSNLSSIQKEKFTYLAEELGQKVQVSDLMELGTSKAADTAKVGAHFGRIVDGSVFQKKLNQMKEEFSKALMKEIEKTPGTENTDTTYVAYKRHRYEKSGITEFLKS